MEYVTMYPNRKMYSKNRTTYITLTQIRDLVKKGEDIQVVRSDNNKDVTTEVLTHVLTTVEVDYNKLKKLISESPEQE